MAGYPKHCPRAQLVSSIQFPDLPRFEHVWPTVPLLNQTRHFCVGGVLCMSISLNCVLSDSLSISFGMAVLVTEVSPAATVMASSSLFASSPRIWFMPSVALYIISDLLIDNYELYDRCSVLQVSRATSLDHNGTCSRRTDLHATSWWWATLCKFATKIDQKCQVSTLEHCRNEKAAQSSLGSSRII